MQLFAEVRVSTHNYSFSKFTLVLINCISTQKMIYVSEILIAFREVFYLTKLGSPPISFAVIFIDFTSKLPKKHA